MKRILKSFVMVFVCCLLCVSFSACAFIDSFAKKNDSNSSSGSTNNENGSSTNGDTGGNGGGTNNTSYSVKVVYDDEDLSFNFSSASSISITPRYRSGYVLEGYYTQPNGGGELLIDYLGKNVSENWKQSKANIIYPYYTEVNYGYVYTSSSACEESPDSFHYNIYGPIYASWLLNYDKSQYIYKVCVSNPEIKVKFTGIADVRAEHSTTGKMCLAMAGKSGSDAMREGELKSTPINLTTSFKNYSTSIEMQASTIKASKDKYFGIGFITNGSVISYYTGYAKNIHFTMSFVV